MKRGYWLIGILMILIFSGCGSKNGKAIDIYTLKYNEFSSKQTSFVQTDKIIKIATPKSTKEIKKNKILYAKMPYQREAYAYSRWSDTPNHLIEQFLVSLLNENGLFKAAVPATSKAKSQWILESTIENFYQYFDEKNRSFGVVKIRFFLINQKDKKLIVKHYFKAKVPTSSLDAKGGVKALNEALEQIGIQLSNWLKQHFEKKI